MHLKLDVIEGSHIGQTSLTQALTEWHKSSGLAEIIHR